MTSRAPAPTEAVARYLEALYYMGAEGEVARSARLADWLGVSRPTVTMALRRMSRDGLIQVAGRQVSLTRKGLDQAAGIVRRHRLMERWLTDALGLDWVTADEEAARLEHALSDKVAERVYEALGRPRTCPHGNPIPGYGEVERGEVRLGSAAPGPARVTRISEVAEREAPALLAYLHERGLTPGAEIDVRAVDAVGQIITVETTAGNVALGRETAAKVWILPGRRQPARQGRLR